MNISVILLLSLGLAMDAFAVSVTNGICLPEVKARHMLMCGSCFGLFQGAMPSIGYVLGKAFENRISAYDHWISLCLLGYIGVKMICDSFEEDNTEEYKLTPSLLLVQGAATSIDALAVGVSFAALSVNIVAAVIPIVAAAFVLSCAGVAAGGLFGGKFNGKARLIGGMILICIGFKIFAEHMWNI